ncbi:MAG: pyridoxal phosphate-dependent aminotransferase [Sulfolobales archaeon]
MSRNTPVSLHLKSLLDEIRGELAFKYIAIARSLSEKGYDVISFGAGQPDLPTPDHIIEAAKRSLDRRFTGYTETAGIYKLREAIAEYLNNRYQASVHPDEIIVTTGAKTAIFTVIASYINPGDEAIIIDPSYPAYGEAVKMMGGKPVFIPLKFDKLKGFQIDLENIESSITSRTKMIVINNPHNPTGAVFPPSIIHEIMRLAERRGLIVLSDEIYDNFIYDNTPFKSVSEYPGWKDHAILINGFSKTFSMTGWRLGYIVARRDVAEKMIRVAVNVYSCATSFAQEAAVDALRGDWTPVKKMIQLFQRRRDVVYEELSKIDGVEVWKPLGAFYIYPRIKEILEKVKMSVEEFVEYLIDKHHVIVLPGTAFSTINGGDFIRLSYSISEERIREGVRRIREGIKELLNR